MKTCLVVDDSDIIRKFIKEIIEEMGFEVFEAADGQEALKECIRKLPDLILLDWHMPIKNGFEFLVEFKAKFADCHTKIIFCSTEQNPDKIQQVLTAGADEYIVKPLDSYILSDKLIAVGLY